MELKISRHSHADYAMVTPRGEIDLYTAPHLHRELISALDDGTQRLVVDLSQVDFCDSTGMNVLLSAMKRAREHGGDLELVAPLTAVRRVLEVTGLDTVFTIHESAEAVALGAGAGPAE